MQRGVRQADLAGVHGGAGAAPEYRSDGRSGGGYARIGNRVCVGQTFASTNPVWLFVVGTGAVT